MDAFFFFFIHYLQLKKTGVILSSYSNTCALCLPVQFLDAHLCHKLSYAFIIYFRTPENVVNRVNIVLIGNANDVFHVIILTTRSMFLFVQSAII